MIELNKKDINKIVFITQNSITLSVVLNNLYVHYLDYPKFINFLNILKFNNITGKNLWYLFNVISNDNYDKFIKNIYLIHTSNFNYNSIKN